MSAEVLRGAAALMRERAEAANDGEDGWSVTECVGQDQGSRRVLGTYSLIHDSSSEVAILRGMSSDRDPVAAHIASWHPTVALAVADWLDGVADGMGARNLKHTNRALAVANAYIGKTP